MINFKEYLLIEQCIEEGVADQGIFKAVFLAGGPGSGKSFVARNTLPNAILGLKVVNSDEALEFLLKKNNLSSNMNTMSPSEMDSFVRMRDRAKVMTGKREQIYLAGRLGMVIDGTGRDYDKIKRKKEELDNMGYDTFMIFVNTSLEVALERNAKRDRSISTDLVKKYWDEVQKNIGKFQNLFGTQNFIVVDNNHADEDVLLKVFKSVKRFVDRPIRSKIARDWVQKQGPAK